MRGDCRDACVPMGCGVIERMRQWIAIIAATTALGAIWVTTNQARRLSAAETPERVRHLEALVGVRPTPGVPSLLDRLQALEARPAGISVQQLTTMTGELDAVTNKLDAVSSTMAGKLDEVASTIDTLEERLQRLSRRAEATETRLTELDGLADQLSRLRTRVDHLASKSAARYIVRDDHLTFEIRQCMSSADDLSCLVSITYNTPIIGVLDTYQVSAAYCTDDLYIFANYDKVKSSVIVPQNGTYTRQVATRVEIGDNSSTEYVKTLINAGDFITTTLHFPKLPAAMHTLDSLLLAYRHCFFQMAQFHDLPLSRGDPQMPRKAAP
jgi:hypothetical protein